MSSRRVHDRPSQPARRSNWRWRLLKKAVYLAYLAVVLEILLQLFYFASTGHPLFYRLARSWYVAAEHGNFRIKPNLSVRHDTPEFKTVVYTNNQGFRVSKAGREYSLARDESTFRVMLLGPSFAFGIGVNYEDSLASLLEKMLAENGFAGERRVELINAGVPALGPLKQFDWYRHVGSKYKPDMVILLQFGSMDVDLNPPQHEVSPEGYLLKEHRSWRRQLRSKLKNSAIIFYAWSATTAVERFLGPGTTDGHIEGAGRRLQLRSKFDPSDEHVKSSLAFYQELRQTVEAGQGELALVFFPLSYCVHPQDVGRWRHLGVRDIDKQTRYNSDFCQYLCEQDFVCVDTTAALLRAAKSGQRLYYWFDIHWTPEGNLVTAQAIADHLRRTRETKHNILNPRPNGQ